MPPTTRILVADDAEGQRLVLGALVEDMGLEVEYAANGVETMAKLENGCDLVLLDAKMPGMDGYEVLRRIRQSEQRRDIPVVMVTGHDCPAHRKQALADGADAFLPKPVSRNDLQSNVYALLMRDKSYPEQPQTART
jgi:CheY-like chemotaxis protein